MRVSWTAPVNNGGTPITGTRFAVASRHATRRPARRSARRCASVTGLLPPRAVHVHGRGDERRRHVGCFRPPQRHGDRLAAPPAWSPGPPLPGLPPQTPIIDFDLTTATAVKVHVPGYVSIPQGQLRLTNPNSLDVTTPRRSAGGVVRHQRSPVLRFRSASKTRWSNARSGSSRRRPADTPHMLSSAIVQVNQGGAWAINSWEVQ